MEDAGFTPAELIHLLSSHTIARSDTLVPGHQAVPFDSTPFTFDTQIFLEVLLKGVGLPFGLNSSTPGAEVDSPIPASGEMRLQSDFALARDPVRSHLLPFWLKSMLTYDFRIAYGLRVAEHGEQPAAHDGQL